MAPFSLIEVKTPETEMTELVRHLVTSFREPPHTYIELVFAEETFDSYDAAIENLVERQTATLQPNCTWLKVVDEESGRIAGAACWRVFDENPYQKAADPIKCTWWPEGSVNDLTCMWMEAITTSRRTFMARPHVWLNSIYTHPDFRRQGVGNMLMAWGVEKADAKGLPAFVEATPSGKHLYSRYGFEYLHDIDVDFASRRSDDEWSKTLERYPGIPLVLLCRSAPDAN